MDRHVPRCWYAATGLAVAVFLVAGYASATALLQSSISEEETWLISTAVVVVVLGTVLILDDDGDRTQAKEGSVSEATGQ